MTVCDALPLNDEHFDAVVLPRLRATNQPLTAQQIFKSLPLSEVTLDTLTKHLDRQVECGRLHRLSRKGDSRYSLHSMQDLARATIRRLVQQRPRTRSELARAITGPLADWSISRRNRCIAEMVSTGELRELPQLLGSRCKRLGLSDPDPTEYLEHSLSELCRRLSGSGVSPNEVWQAAGRLVQRQMNLESNSPATAPQSTTHQCASPPNNAEFSGADQQDHSGQEPMITLAAECAVSCSAMEPGITPAATAETLSRQILQSLPHIEPSAPRGALVAFRDLRRFEPFRQLDKHAFDDAVLALSRSGCISLHRHDFVSSLIADERADLVTDGHGNFFIGLALRR